MRAAPPIFAAARTANMMPDILVLLPLDGVWLAPGGFPQQEELGGERGTWNELLGGLDRLRQERCEIAPWVRKLELQKNTRSRPRVACGAASRSAN